MNQYIFDLEGDSLTPTKIHCISAHKIGEKGVKSTTDRKRMGSLFRKADVLIGHNIIRFDIPVVDGLLGDVCGGRVKAKLVDTLALSWYLYPTRPRHGLAEWGEEFGVPKPKIDNWEDLPIEEYIHRCEEDVKINTKLWDKMWKHLLKIYGTEEDAWHLIDYLMFKMDCAREQERSGWKLDEEKAKKGFNDLSEKHYDKVEILKGFMPKVKKYTNKTRPKKPYKKDGSLSAIGEKWFSLLKEKGYPEAYNREIKVVVGEEEPNPNSHDQVKEWLFSLGWVPENFDVKRGKDWKDVRHVPQVRVDGDDGKELCPSVVKLKNKSDGIEALEGITVLAHRLSILKGFLKNVDDEGYVQAKIQGLANTLRFKHSVVVNLPGVHKPYGELIRGCLIASEGYELCGSDMVGIEETTKRHYMYDYDPEYVAEMDEEGFDAHLDICLLAGMLTQEEVDNHKNGTKSQRAIRHKGKTTNYAATYGAKGPTVARAAGIPNEEGDALVETYWKRNWAILKIAENCEVKVVDKQKWLFNPVSKIWYSLRHEKDRFSTLNQGTATYCFDMWIKYAREKRSQLTAQFHDECVLCIKEGFREKAFDLLKWAISQVNNDLKLNRRLDVDVQFGRSYSEIH